MIVVLSHQTSGATHVFTSLSIAGVAAGDVDYNKALVKAKKQALHIMKRRELGETVTDFRIVESGFKA